MSTAAPSSPDTRGESQTVTPGEMQAKTFRPSFGLRSAHAQTILSSSLNPVLARKRARETPSVSEDRILTASDGVRLHAYIHEREGAPLVVLLHGWLGGADAIYIKSIAGKLFHAGYAVARLNLRDHGGSEALNEGMFHSARIDEVVDAVRSLCADRPDENCALLGFSLGGNFALRVSARTGLYTVACCPVIDPAGAMPAIDNSPIYRRYFVKKWHRSLLAKASAFPDAYDVDAALRLNTVADLTDHFVELYTEYGNSADYFDAYSVDGDRLREANAKIIAAADDPVIPGNSFANLPSSIELVMTDRGGHCGYLANWSFDSWFDQIALSSLARHFDSEVHGNAESLSAG